MNTFLKKFSFVLVTGALFFASTSYAGHKTGYKKLKQEKATKQDKEKLFKAINEPNIKETSRIIDTFPKLISQKNAEGRTPIQQAAYKAKAISSMGMGITPKDQQDYVGLLYIIYNLLYQGAQEKELENYQNVLNAAKAQGEKEL